MRLNSLLIAVAAAATWASPTVALRAQTGNPRPAPDTAFQRWDGGRFSVLAVPSDARLARTLLGKAIARDTFPGLPRPRAHVTIAVAPDAQHFRLWAGPTAPEWGAAIAFPHAQRVIVQGGAATSAAGDPVPTLRHELAHLALHEYLDDLPPRWFDEGYATYASGQGTPDDILATNVALAFHGVPSLAALDTGLVAGEEQAGVSYALATRAVADLAALDRTHGLSLLFHYWHSTGSLDMAVRQAYGETLDAFEARWQAQMRRRYGALAIVSDMSFATLIFLALLLPLYLARRRRDQRRLAALRAAEVAAAAALPDPALLLSEIPIDVPKSGNRVPEDATPGSDGAAA